MWENFRRQGKALHMLHVEMIVLSNHKPRTRALISKISLFSHFDMNDNRVKCKAWMHCKDAKISRTTAWRSKTIGKGNVCRSLMSDSSVKMSIVAEESVRSSSSVSDNELMFTFANHTGFQSGHSCTESQLVFNYRWWNVWIFRNMLQFASDYNVSELG